MVSGKGSVARSVTRYHRYPGIHHRHLLLTTAIATFSAMAAPAHAQGMTAVGDVTPIQAGPSWVIPGPLIVGDSGMGGLDVNGGNIISDSGIIGRSASSTGAVAMSGVSFWSNNGDLIVGGSGTATLAISNFGQATASQISIGSSSGSYGGVTVTDGSARLTSAGILRIGEAGSGYLTVDTGGIVHASAVIVAEQAGSAGGLDLNGSLNIASGMVETGYIAKGLGAGTITANGGGFRATQTIADYLQNFGNVTIGAGSMVVDTSIYDIGIGATTALVGSGGIVKWGSGTLTLNGSGNTYAGDTVLYEGTLRAVGENAFSRNSSVELNLASRLDLNGYNQTIGALTSTGPGTVTNSGGRAAVLTTVVQGTSPAAFFSGSLQDGASPLGLTKTGFGTMILSGNNTYSGATTIDQGTLRADASGALSHNSAVTVGYSGTLDLGSYSQDIGSLAGNGTVTNSGGVLVQLSTGYDNSSTTFSGTIHGGGLGLIKTGSGVLTLTGTNTYSGGTGLLGGELTVGNDWALGTGGLVVLAAGTLSAAYNTAVTLPNSVDIHANLTISGNGNLGLNGMVGGGGSIIKNGGGNLTLNGANLFSGGMNLVSGSLTLGSNTALGSGMLRVIGGGTLDANTAIALSNDVDLQTALAVGGTNDLALNGIVSGGGSIIKTGAADLTLNSSNSFSGGVQLMAGSLTLGSVFSLGTGALTVGGAATLKSNTNALLFNNVTLDANLSIVGGSYIEMNGSIGGTGSLTYNGTGVLALNSSNGFTGGFNLAGGTIAISTNAALGNGILHVTGDASLSGSLAGLYVVNAINLDAGKTLDLNGGNDLTITGMISGGGNLQISNASVTLLGANSHAGATTISSGSTLYANATGALSNLSAITVDTGGRLDLGNDDQTIGALAGAGSVTSGGPGRVLTTGGDNSSTIFAGDLQNGAGTLGITKIGSGTMTLSGTANSYTGATLVSGGTLNVNGSIASSSLLTVASGARLAGSGTVGSTTVQSGGRIAPGNSIGTLNVAGDLTLASGSILDFELGSPGAAANPAAGTSDRIAVSGNLVLDGIINLGQSGTPADGAAGLGYYRLISYNGTLTDNGLAIGTTPALADPAAYQIQAGSGRVDLFVAAAGDDTIQHWQGGNGTWDAAGTTWLNQNGVMPVAWAGKNAVFKDAGSFTGGTIAVSGDHSFQGLQFVDTGYALAGAGRLLIDGSARADGNAEIRVLGDFAVVDTVIAGTGGLTKTGAGDLYLRGINSYAGGTRIADGTVLVLQDANLGAAAGGITFDGGALVFQGSLSSSRGITLNADGNFDTVGQIQVTLGGAISGSGDLVKTGSGRLVLNGANSYTGDTLVEAGSLAGDSASIRGDIANGSLIDFHQLSDGSFAGDIRGLNGASGLMYKDGAGVLTLTGTSSLGWHIVEGGLIATAGNFTGDAVISGGAAFTLAGSGAATYANQILGTGAFNLSGSGRLTLTGDSAGFAGTSSVLSGTLRVDGALGGTVQVGTGGSLEGTGQLGAVDVSGSGALIGRAGDTLTIGSLTLGNDANVVALVGTPSSSALFSVTGDLTLDGRLSVTDAGGFGAGVYRLFDYGGTLVDNGLVLDILPTGVSAGDLAIQTALAGQVNIISSAGADLLFWDGSDAARHNDGVIDGGDGIWAANGAVWTNGNGLASGAMRPAPGFAIFQAAGGTVTLDDSAGALAVSGMQFASDGYRLTGDALGLAGTGGRTVIRVGDGTAAGAAMTATIASELTGASDLVKADRGTLRLTGANSYTGNTLVEAGTLIGDSAAIRGDIANAGTVIFNQVSDGSFTGAIAGLEGVAGTMVKTGAATLALTGASSLDWRIEQGTLATTTQGFSGNAMIASGATLLFDQSASGRYAGGLSGAGTLAIDGGPHIELTGDSRAFAGGIDVRNGKLIASGSFGGLLRIGAAGIVGGNGTLGTTSVEAGGIISPGNSIGLLTVNGDISFAAGSTYQVEVDPTGSAADRIAATGRALLNGGTVAHIGFSGDYQPNASYTILTAAGGIQGQFADVTSTYAFLTPSLSYSANAVTLTLDRNDIGFASVGVTGNQRATASAVEALGMGNTLYQAVVTLTADQAATAFDSLSGEIHASLGAVLTEDSRFIRAAAFDRMRNAGAAVDAQRGTAWWMQGIGSWGRIDGNDNARRVKHSAAGLLMGIDAIAAETVQLGLFGGWQKGDADLRAASSDADIDSYHLGLYAGADTGRFSLRSGFAFSWHDADITRDVRFEGFSDTAKSRRQASTAQGFAEIGYRFTLGGTAIEPFAGIAHVSVDSEATREQGGAAALTLAHDVMTTDFTTAGAHIRRAFDLGSMGIDLNVTAGWRHAFGDRTPEAALAFANGGRFLVSGTPIAKDALSTDIGLGLALSSRAHLDIAYTSDAAASAQNHGGKATFSLAF